MTLRNRLQKLTLLLLVLLSPIFNSLYRLLWAETNGDSNGPTIRRHRLTGAVEKRCGFTFDDEVIWRRMEEKT